MKKNILPMTKNNNTLWMGIGVLALLGGATYWWVRKRKTDEDELLLGITEDSPKKVQQVARSSRFRCVNKSYPLRYGTCHADVKILQRYLKVYNEDLGTSGPGRDGVDGMFGSKTAKAARKRLGKVAFNEQDIKGMKTSIKMIRK